MIWTVANCHAVTGARHISRRHKHDFACVTLLLRVCLVRRSDQVVDPLGAICHLAATQLSCVIRGILDSTQHPDAFELPPAALDGTGSLRCRLLFSARQPGAVNTRRYLEGNLLRRRWRMPASLCVHWHWRACWHWAPALRPRPRLPLTRARQ